MLSEWLYITTLATLDKLKGEIILVTGTVECVMKLLIKHKCSGDGFQFKVLIKIGRGFL